MIIFKICFWWFLACEIMNMCYFAIIRLFLRTYHTLYSGDRSYSRQNKYENYFSAVEIYYWFIFDQKAQIFFI